MPFWNAPPVAGPTGPQGPAGPAGTSYPNALLSVDAATNGSTPVDVYVYVPVAGLVTQFSLMLQGDTPATLQCSLTGYGSAISLSGANLAGTYGYENPGTSLTAPPNVLHFTLTPSGGAWVDQVIGVTISVVVDQSQ